MPNGTYGGVRGRKTKVGRKLLLFSSYSIAVCRAIALVHSCCVLPAPLALLAPDPPIVICVIAARSILREKHA